MPFVKGHKRIGGRAKGVLNNPDVASIKVLLEDAFVRNYSAAYKKIDNMFQSEDNTDFKFLLSLKASLEPRQIAHSGNIGITVSSIMQNITEAEAIANKRVEDYS